MKRILSLFGILSAVVFSAQNNLTNTENYTYTKECLNADCTKVSESVQYFDSFGRPFQAVSIKSSPSGKDMVQHIPYDSYGRKVDSWFPVPMPTSGGAVHDTAAVKSNAVSLYGDNRPFSHTVLDNSPLDRVLQQISPGQDWQNHPAAFAYETNINGEVKKYMVSSSWTEGRTESVLSLPGSYPANTLTKNTVTDQDGKVSVEYKNKQGQLILARKGAGTPDVADTYYVYNEFGHLVYVIPPLASASGSVSQDTLEKLCYQYRYDGWNRLVEKRLPGKGWEYMVYDKADKLILTQDANQRTSFSWMIYKYDAWGRPIYTGILTANNTRPGMQSQISDTSVIESRNTTGLTANDMTYYYSNMYWGLNTLLSVTYYDSYPQQYGFNPPFPSTILGEPVLTETPDADGRSTKGLPVMSLVKNIENDSWTKTYTYYDQKGRAIGTYSINHLGGYTKTESKLDFAGLTLQTKAYHKRLATDTEKLITQTYDYDAQGRLLVHKHKIDNNPEEILKQNTYNELSQIVNKKVGGTNVSSPLQSIDYTYNILGWLTKINDPANLNGKLFGYEMKYFNPQNTTSTSGKYGGNITEIDWKTVTDNVLRRYDYQYDALNRLKKGIYSEPGSSVPQNDFYNEAMSYDLNGNVSSLQRNTKGEGTAQQIDNLIYTYTGNRLQTVVDNTGNYMGYPDSSGSAISYDDNGNMTDHIDKGILEIKYNYLNLPGRMKFSTTYVIRNNETGEDETRNVRSEYIYRADRTKLRKKYTFEFRKNNTERTNTTDYLDGFQYTINHLNTVSLDFVPTSEGYYDFKNNKYIYNYTDQLGNVRLSYQNNGSGAAVLEENNYYPFGLKHYGYNSTSGNPDYRYQYNGKELQDDTGMLDYGWRQYMPELGRWNGMDQLSEAYRSFSPYAYVVNNPITLADPDGRLSQDFMDMVNKSSHGTVWTNRDGNFYSNRGGAMDGSGRSLNSIQAAKENDGGGGFWGGIKNFFGNIFSKKEKGAGISTFLAGATVSRVTTGIVQIGEVTNIGGASYLKGLGTGVISTGAMTLGAILYPTMIAEPEFDWTRNFDKTIDVPIITTDVNKNGILLYRGVSSNAHTKTQAIMYNEALFGIAIPNGLRPGETAHWDMDAHAMGDNYSVFTSWTLDSTVARDFATSYGTASGVILSKRFKVGVNAIPNISINAQKMQEGEWLIFGPVIRANVQHIKP